MKLFNLSILATTFLLAQGAQAALCGTPFDEDRVFNLTQNAEEVLKGELLCHADTDFSNCSFMGRAIYRPAVRCLSGNFYIDSTTVDIAYGKENNLIRSEEARKSEATKLANNILANAGFNQFSTASQSSADLKFNTNNDHGFAHEDIYLLEKLPAKKAKHQEAPSLMEAVLISKDNVKKIEPFKFDMNQSFEIIQDLPKNGWKWERLRAVLKVKN